MVVSPISIKGMGILQDRLFGDAAPDDLVDPAGVEQHDRQEDDCDPEGDQQRQTTGTGIPECQAGFGIGGRDQQEGEQRKTHRQ